MNISMSWPNASSSQVNLSVGKDKRIQPRNASLMRTRFYANLFLEDKLFVNLESIALRPTFEFRDDLK